MRANRLLGVAGAAVLLSFAAMHLPVGSRAEDAKEPAKEPAKAAATHGYIGAKACKPCHTGATKGEMFEIWSKSKHFSALTNLPGDKQKDPACLPCHSTGYQKGGYAPDGPTALTLGGVQCEACHGPGSDYKALKTMKDKAASIAGGLIEPTEKTCQGCHNTTMPQACWAGKAEAPKFVYAERLKTIEHHVPKK